MKYTVFPTTCVTQAGLTHALKQDYLITVEGGGQLVHHTSNASPATISTLVMLVSLL